MAGRTAGASNGAPRICYCNWNAAILLFLAASILVITLELPGGVLSRQTDEGPLFVVRSLKNITRGLPLPGLHVLGSNTKVNLNVEVNVKASNPPAGSKVGQIKEAAGGDPGPQSTKKSRVGSSTTVDDSAVIPLENRHPLWQLAAEDGLVLWTLANYAWLEFVLNWVARVRSFVACLDKEIQMELQKRGIPVVPLQSSIGPGELVWGSSGFKQRGREKIWTTQFMLSIGLQPLYSDLDVVWLRDPFPYVRKFPEAHMLISLDQIGPKAMHGELEPCPAALANTPLGMMNVGIHLVRPPAAPLVQAWFEGMLRGQQMEQWHFNSVLLPDIHAAQDSASLATNQSYCWGMADKVRIGLLPVPLFTHGQAYFIQRMDGWSKMTPYAVHASHIFGQQPKQLFLRERLLWQADKDDRFWPPGGMLSFDMDVPAEMLAASGPPVPYNRSHMLELEDTHNNTRLINHQLKQIRVAMQVAAALGRVLIMPQLWCGLESSWRPHAGRSPGSHDYPLPSRCPLNILFDMEMWLRLSANPGASPLPRFYESSFLQNPKLPAIVRNSRLNITLCAGGKQSQPAATSAFKHWLGGKPAVVREPPRKECGRNGKRFTLESSLTDVDLRSALKDTGNISILHFPDIASIWAGYAAPETEAAFKAAAQGLTRPWCCDKDNLAIPYDLFWDEVPHTDRWGKTWRRPWEPFLLNMSKLG